MKKLQMCLDGTWQLRMAPNAEFVRKNTDPHTVAELQALGYSAIASNVPGNFELALVDAGLAPEPYFACNPLKFRQYENCHLWYSRFFDAPFTADENTFLKFNGIDTIADIFLNGEKIGHTENMLIAHEFPASLLKAEQNELMIHIFPTAIVARQYALEPINRAQRYNYASLHIRKAAYMFGWDIMPRFLSGGLWKSVFLLQKPRERIEQFYLYTVRVRPERQTAYLDSFFEIHTEEDDLRGLTLLVDAVCGDSEFHMTHAIWHTYGTAGFSVKDARYWFPKNAGEAALYHVTVRLMRDGVLCDEKSFRFGIRTVELIRSSVDDADGNGEFVFKINGKKIFCLGTNWVPLDAFPSRMAERLPQALVLLDDLGCNMVRCWGGNVYENDSFYDFCDEHGIMVWQDFGMGCAVYPQDNAFSDKLLQEAKTVIRRLRGHASLVLWAGDNENDMFYCSCGIRLDPNRNRLTRELLRRAVEECDMTRPYLPSSPYIDDEAFRSGKPTPEDHVWGSIEAKSNFKHPFYTDNVCHFISETGVHGCPSPESLRRFLSADRLWPIRDEEGHVNADWLCHASEMQCNESGPYAYRIPLIFSQIENMFDTFPNCLADFAKASQIYQAEALKFFIERVRISKWRRTGILWWNLIDGWPQISDAVVDWYGRKKLAYHMIRRSQAPICLIIDGTESGRMTVYAVNDTAESQSLQYRVRNMETNDILAEGSAFATADQSTVLLKLPERKEFGFFLIEWTLENGVCGSNHYLVQSGKINYNRYLCSLNKAGFDCFEGF